MEEMWNMAHPASRGLGEITATVDAPVHPQL